MPSTVLPVLASSVAPVRLAILGSTGSIGTQALAVVAAHPGRFRVQVLTAHSNAALLIEQAHRWRPAEVVIGDETKFASLQAALAPLGIAVSAGAEAVAAAATRPDVDTVLTALVGYAGLLPTLAAIRAGKTIALANKETLVVAGELVMAEARRHGTRLLPVDSEHSAIYQCLVGEAPAAVEKIILTASGGPFRGKRAAELATITKAQALRHPNWKMGAKITIDSASLMNKGLEVIEAKWLFNLTDDQIAVVVHPQSTIHSLVQFVDGSLKAQLGLPDMKLPIQYALGLPDRLANDWPRFSFLDYPTLTFEAPDCDTFRCLPLAFAAMARAGTAPCILNAANEVAVAAFLRDEISFLAIPDLIGECLATLAFTQSPTLADYISTDEETRRYAAELAGIHS
ncbi:MAG: 1-deoxy-D-xylulose-5-phosphate reductoisomerase [Hymenobacteraceae bacterium]|nr:1-deoxy-D-xylulose-5-phosphate reductoisomerase [Hymenobacteraceae bacterium]